MSTVEIRVTGTVQGVGFRPTVFRLAREEGLSGEVCNDSAGVLIRVAGEKEAIARLVARLQSEPPPLAHIEGLTSRPLDGWAPPGGFRISESVPGENRTRVTPDAAICEACREEVLGATDRRSGYPFTNCTHCGPRFSIVTGVPYDRARTTMAPFPMCAVCAAEYQDPADRRFHAQPIACPACGPKIWIESAGGQSPSPTSEVIAAALACLEQGGIVAIRGLGGFHLACDATNPTAVERLRTRKHRFGKPFALMARDVAIVRRYAEVTPLAERLLQSPEAPIVLLPAKGPDRLPPSVAPGLDFLGFLLPYTPLHLLILQGTQRPLVMTSGNLSDEPQVTANDEARTRLAGIADAWVFHDREIANRIDDSVVQIVRQTPRLLRRARGHAPAAIPLPPGFEGAPDLLAFGAELKSTFCLVKDGAAILSQHQGDLEDAATFEDYQKNLALYTDIYNHAPRALAADLHPEYLSTKLAHETASRTALPLHEIQHHHAHAAACMAENNVPLDAGPVIAIALDGLGLGDDGTLWGGEVLLADYRSFRRLAALRPVPMPGAAQAIREPWRNTYAHLVTAFGWESFLRRFPTSPLRRSLETKPIDALDRMIARNIQSPLASSCGRLFDAVAAAVGLCPDRALFEGQGAMELEAAAAKLPPGSEGAYPFALLPWGDTHSSTLGREEGTSAHDTRSPESSTSSNNTKNSPSTKHPAGLWLDPTPMWTALLTDLDSGAPVTVMASRFHEGLARSLTHLVRAVRGQLLPSVPARLARTIDDGLPPSMPVVLTGGCFQNALLLARMHDLLDAAGLVCLSHARVPTNDGGLALGQAAIAAARTLSEQKNLRDSPCPP